MGNTKYAPTPGQTIGPFFGYALPYHHDNRLVTSGTPGAVRLHGTITDGHGVPVPDALLEIWQLDGEGNVVQRTGSMFDVAWQAGEVGKHSRTDEFTGWGRTEADREGGYWFRTIEPGAKDGKAPFIVMVIFARGLMNRLFTRIYLPENTEALAADKLLSSLPAERRDTLIAKREADGSLRFDIKLHSDDETVFLTYDADPDAGKDGVGA